jgi:hypothetical protein
MIFNCEEKLPPDRTYVLGWYGRSNHLDLDDPVGVNWKVVKFVCGLSQHARALLPDNDPRKRQIRSEDEHGNNLKPYYWNQFGPSSYFGQDITQWSPLPCESYPVVMERANIGPLNATWSELKLLRTGRSFGRALYEVDGDFTFHVGIGRFFVPDGFTTQGRNEEEVIFDCLIDAGYPKWYATLQMRLISRACGRRKLFRRVPKWSDKRYREILNRVKLR